MPFMNLKKITMGKVRPFAWCDPFHFDLGITFLFFKEVSVSPD